MHASGGGPRIANFFLAQTPYSGCCRERERERERERREREREREERERERERERRERERERERERRPRQRQQQQQATATTGGGGDTNWGLLLNLHTLPRGTVGPSPTQPPQQPSRDGARNQPKTAAGEPPADPRRRRAASSSTQPARPGRRHHAVGRPLPHHATLPWGGRTPELFVERGSEIHLRSYPYGVWAGVVMVQHSRRAPDYQDPRRGYYRVRINRREGGDEPPGYIAVGTAFALFPWGAITNGKPVKWLVHITATTAQPDSAATELPVGTSYTLERRRGEGRVGTGAATTQTSTPVLLRLGEHERNRRNLLGVAAHMDAPTQPLGTAHSTAHPAPNPGQTPSAQPHLRPHRRGAANANAQRTAATTEPDASSSTAPASTGDTTLPRAPRTDRPRRRAERRRRDDLHAAHAARRQCSFIEPWGTAASTAATAPPPQRSGHGEALAQGAGSATWPTTNGGQSPATARAGGASSGAKQ